MCITETTSYRYGDKLYDTELKAVEGALQDLGSMLVKEHSANLAAGLIQHREKLEYLLNRYHVLSPPTPTATEVTSENSERGPKVSYTRDQVHCAMLDAAKKCKPRVKSFIKSLGVEDLSELLEKPGLYQKAHDWALAMVNETTASRNNAIHDAFEELRGDRLLHAHGFFMQLGYTILEDFLAGATPKQKARMEELVGLRGEDD